MVAMWDHRKAILMLNYNFKNLLTKWITTEVKDVIYNSLKACVSSKIDIENTFYFNKIKNTFSLMFNYLDF